MDTTGEEEPEPIRLKSIKNNKTFTVPQSDRVRKTQTQTRGCRDSHQERNTHSIKITSQTLIISVTNMRRVYLKGTSDMFHIRFNFFKAVMLIPELKYR